MEVTYKRLRSVVYWKHLFRDVASFVVAYDICQSSKPENSFYSRLLQPLPIPQRIWTNISMDFIEGFPVSRWKDVILVVVDRLSKYAHFLALAHPYSAIMVA